MVKSMNFNKNTTCITFIKDYEASNQDDVWDSLIQDLNKVSFSDTDEEDLGMDSLCFF